MEDGENGTLNILFEVDASVDLDWLRLWAADMLKYQREFRPPTPLYTLTYTVRFASGETTYQHIGVTGVTLKDRTIHVTYDDPSPIAGAEWDIEGDLVSLTLTLEE